MNPYQTGDVEVIQVYIISTYHIRKLYTMYLYPFQHKMPFNQKKKTKRGHYSVQNKWSHWTCLCKYDSDRKCLYEVSLNSFHYLLLNKLAKKGHQSVKMQSIFIKRVCVRSELDIKHAVSMNLFLQLLRNNLSKKPEPKRYANKLFWVFPVFIS